MMRMLVAGLAILVSASGCEKPRGACEVEYDGISSKGDACTVVREDQCTDPVSPAVVELATSKVKKFTTGSTCQDIGYAKSGCPEVPIAWSFKTQCPEP
jgi:hypothetical protein